MTLSSDEIARAGEAALRLLDLSGRVAVTDVPAWIGSPEDQYVDLLGDGWQGNVIVHPGRSLIGATVWIADQVSEYISESDAFWGVAFPRCPDHAHPARLGEDDRSVALRCPTTGEEIRRVTV